jgi:hypothetical protein
MISCLPNCVYSAILSHKEWTSFWGAGQKNYRSDIFFAALLSDSSDDKAQVVSSKFVSGEQGTSVSG